jgi:serine/threonine-protein kinase
MELLEGESLGGRIRRVGPLPIRDVIEFTFQTASALGAAHKKGIVHRDLKPDNLYVTQSPLDPGRELIKVLDFGIAKLQQTQIGDSVRTRTGTLMGTPIYMSPEQCRGTRTVDHRSDVYSLGVIVHEMLTGQPPFVSEGFGELINMHLNVAPPSSRALRPEVPLALDALVLKMLAKNPEDRFADMTALQGALSAAGVSHSTLPGAGGTEIMHAATQAQPAVMPGSLTPGPEISRMAETHDTTFSRGVGERQSILVAPGGRGRRVFGALVAVAMLGGGFAVWRLRAQSGAGTAAATPVAEPAAPTPAPTAPVPPPPPEEPPKAPAAPATVSVHVESSPAGARVVDVEAGDLLGATPLSLSRPKGSSLKLRLEKEGYAPAVREVSLDADQKLQFSLDKRAKSHAAHKVHETHEAEPAKL